MFLPPLLTLYDASLKGDVDALWEKFAPILYWRPIYSLGEVHPIIETTLVPTGSRSAVVEVKSKIDFGRDVVACNLMSDDKEMYKQSLETLHRYYTCKEEWEVPGTMMSRDADPRGWRVLLEMVMEPGPQRTRILDNCGQNWYQFHESLLQSVEEQVQKFNQGGAPVQWYLSPPIPDSSERRRICMQLTQENITEAMARVGGFPEAYRGQPLFREETYAVKGTGYRFAPGDWVMLDVIHSSCLELYDAADERGLEDHIPYCKTSDGKYILKRIRKVLGGEETWISNINAESLKKQNKNNASGQSNGSGHSVQKHVMVRAIDLGSFMSTHVTKH